MTFPAPDIPTLCCTAPEMPKAMYRSGDTILPDIPTCLERGIQPRSTRAREQHTAPPSFPATDSATSMSDLSRMPSPRAMSSLALEMSTSFPSFLSSETTSLIESPAYCQ